MTNPNLRGALFGVLGMAVYCAYDITIKYLGGNLSPMQILFCAGLVFVPLILAQIATGKAGGLRPVFPRLTLVRAVIALFNAVIGAYAFATLPLAECYSVFFLMPLMIALLAIPVLGEPMDPLRGFAILLGFGGVLVVLNPVASSTLGLGHLAAFTAAALGAINYVLIRKTSGRESPAVLMFYPAVLQLAALGMAMPGVWQPMLASQWLLAGLMGVELFVGGLLIILAYRTAAAVVVAPMQYSQIIWAALLGQVLFGETMTLRTALGIGLIILAGLVILTKSSRHRVPEAA